MGNMQCFHHNLLIVITVLLLSRTEISLSQKRNRRQTEDFNAGGLPRHLPSPPEHPSTTVAAPAGGQASSTQTNFPTPPPEFFHPEMEFMNNMVAIGDEVGLYPFPYFFPQESMVTTTKSEAETTTAAAADDEKEEEAEEEDDDSPAPLGFDETILILVPQFKFTLSGFPKWTGASIRMSLPITIFFDELDWPKNPAPLPRSLSTGFGSFLFNGKWMGMGAGARRKSRSILSLPPADSLRGGERATLIPKVEQMLGRFGIGKGRACLLRTVCEVHEAKVHHTYGLFGEFLTRVFTISKSPFSEALLPSYLEAEERGKEGNCSKYFKKCSHSLFHQNECY